MELEISLSRSQQSPLVSILNQMNPIHTDPFNFWSIIIFCFRFCSLHSWKNMYMEWPRPSVHHSPFALFVLQPPTVFHSVQTSLRSLWRHCKSRKPFVGPTACAMSRFLPSRHVKERGEGRGGGCSVTIQCRLQKFCWSEKRIKYVTHSHCMGFIHVSSGIRTCNHAAEDAQDCRPCG
jgi:hypothetical protein